MKLSTKGRYGLRAMVDIAVYSQDSPVPISAIAERQNISVRYLEQLLPKLKKAGIIKSIRGAQGGYMLDKDPKDISAGDILRTLEGDLTPIDCAAFTGDTSTCSGTKFCVTKTVWQKKMNFDAMRLKSAWPILRVRLPKHGLEIIIIWLFQESYI